jgi:serine O-acetyltransferase
VPDSASTSTAAGLAPLECLRADTFRQFGASSWKLTLQGALTRRTFRPIVTMRLCQAAAVDRRWYLPLCQILHRIATQRAAMDFPWRTSIGPGFIITHGWGLVINAGATIGKNVTLFHGVTLGQRDRISPDGQRTTAFPVLEDDVWVGPHAIVVGGITIGRGSRIAGGAFVGENIPPRCIVGGNPASILKTECLPDVTNPAP